MSALNRFLDGGAICAGYDVFKDSIICTLCLTPLMLWGAVCKKIVSDTFTMEVC